MTDIAVHIFDPDATSDSTHGNQQTHARSIAESGSVLTEFLTSDSNGVCCVASAELVPDSDQFSAAVDELRSAGASIGVLPDSVHSDLTYIWRRLPSALAAFVMPPESRGAILFDTSQSIKGLSENSDRPVQEIVIRAAMQNPETVVLLNSGEGFNESPLPRADVGLPELAPRHPGGSRNWLAGFLKQLNPQKYLSGAGDPCDAEAILAGLLQINDYLDESHNHSQSIQGEGQDVNGDYWHGIMHRREPDYGNGKYWFRRVGDHPCFDLLPALADQAFDDCNSSDAADWKSRLARPNGWDDAAFIDLCQTVESSSDPDLTTAAKRIQWAEMLLLLDYSYRRACGN
jgi:hypothetical protein